MGGVVDAAKAVPVAWNSEAIVWLNDEQKGRVIVGPYGFAWWDRSKVILASFGEKAEVPIGAVHRFTAWEGVKSFHTVDATTSVVLRFVRTGLLPASTRTG